MTNGKFGEPFRPTILSRPWPTRQDIEHGVRWSCPPGPPCRSLASSRLGTALRRTPRDLLRRFWQVGGSPFDPWPTWIDRLCPHGMQEPASHRSAETPGSLDYILAAALLTFARPFHHRILSWGGPVTSEPGVGGTSVQGCRMKVWLRLAQAGERYNGSADGPL
jgi:hypothetical protein